MDAESTAKQYQKIKLYLSISEALLSFLLLTGFVYFGYSAQLRDAVLQMHPNAYVQLILFTLILGTGFLILFSPFSIISGFWLEHRFNLSNQNFSAWLWEQTKQLILGLVLLLPLLLGVYYFLRSFPQSWWLWTAVVLFIFSVLLGKVAPQIIFPLFYKFEPISDDTLLERMKGLAAKGKFSLTGVYRFNMSKTTKKANAAFTGLGKSRRIILGDTLLEEFTNDEIEAVFAHEVGHFINGHLTKGIVRGTALSFLSLYLAAQVYTVLIGRLGFYGASDLAALPLLSLILSVFVLITTPLENLISRRYERQADKYAIRNCKDPQAFISAMQKLSKMNLSETEPHPIVEFLFHSHPSVKSRIEAAEKWKARTRQEVSSIQ